MGNNKMIIDIQRLPLPLITRMRLERRYIMAAKAVKRALNAGKAEDTSEYYPLVRNNRMYGHEYLLRRFSGSRKDLYSIIEHGLYFGRNRQKPGAAHEWELGCILTSGPYRKDLINEVYPHMFCEMTGPMIHYARTDDELDRSLREHMLPGERTLLFYPAHSTEVITMEYDFSKTMERINRIADLRQCGNIVVCVNLFDAGTYQRIDYGKVCPGKNVQITSNGERYDSHFLDHQRTMVQAADLTVSNQLGTHIGYCVYLGKPHILLPQTIEYRAEREVLQQEYGTATRSENWAADYSRETKMFQEIFCLEQSDSVNGEQYRLCDDYWGFSKVKNPEEIAELYSLCRQKAKRFIREHRDRHSGE